MLRPDARNRNFTSVFGDRTSFRAKELRPDALQLAILPQFLAIEPHFVRKGCVGRFATRNFTSVFGDRTSFRARGLCRTLCNSQFYLSFWRSNLISCEKVASDALQLAILRQFLAIESGFVRKGLRFVPSRWHCPAPSRENLRPGVDDES